MELIKAIINTKSKDYLLGYIDSIIFMKNQANCQRLEVNNDKISFETDQNDILGPVYLDITCSCGNYVAFKSGEEIPEKSFKCTLCEEKYLIYYYGEK